MPKWLASLFGPVLRVGRDIVQLSVLRGAVRRRAQELIAQERVGGVLATSDDGIFLIASYQAARAAHVPFCVLLLDIYARNNYSLLKRTIARFYEPRILRYARRVFVTNPRAQAHYKELYGIEPIVLEHASPSASPLHAKASRDQPVIAYTGSVYWAQADAVGNLVDALLTIPEASLELVTEQTESDLRRLNLVRGRVRVRRATHDETRRVQKDADVLFLPLSFGDQAPDLIRTAAPGKMAEYLVSGVPVLVHAPADSYIARDAREQGWGLVVDRPDIQELVLALRRLLSDGALRERLVGSAMHLGTSRHDEARLGARFRDELRAAFG
jgi:glycosyltransferase involved in cell wall biosynthesis